ncbi:MAG TPA: class I SAM-dependent methyltransferase [Gaiellaceae bacterium]|nr:class I SAM-dependent methyltransferase [Gaiellaceae bacterium]
MTSELHEAAAQGFSSAAASYEEGRPTYPPAAVARLERELHLGPGRVVLDLAAGTGKLTALLVCTGATVVAIEPVAEMRAVLERALPRVRALPGTAEAIPLPRGSVDAVTVAQAFHWFRGEEALADIHRVLRPGGGLGLVWNDRDESVAWVARLTEIMEQHRGDVPSYRSVAWQEAFEQTALFGPLGHAESRHVHRLTPDGVIARVASVSFVATLPEPERERVLAEVRGLLATDPETRGRADLDFPYRTDVYWAERA